MIEQTFNSILTANAAESISVGKVIIIGVGIVLATAVVGKIVKDKRTKIEEAKRKKFEEEKKAHTETIKKVFEAKPNMVNAELAFKSNINKFIPILDGVDKEVWGEEWDNAIIDINDRDLTSLWYLTRKKPSAWINQLAAWGIKFDACQSFVAIEKHKDMYECLDKSEILVGEKYDVVSPLWMQTSVDMEEKTSKRIIKKGLVKVSEKGR